MGFRRYNLSWSSVATTDPGCSGTRLHIVLEVSRAIFCRTPHGSSPLADEAVIRKFWRHFEGSNGALGRDSKRVTFSFVLVIYTLYLASVIASLGFVCTVLSSNQSSHPNPSQKWTFPSGAVRVASFPFDWVIPFVVSDFSPPKSPAPKFCLTEFASTPETRSDALDLKTSLLPDSAIGSPSSNYLPLVRSCFASSNSVASGCARTGAHSSPDLVRVSTPSHTPFFL